jgi:cyanophycinase
MGQLLLEGGAEFAGRMSEPDLQASQRAGGQDVIIAILPTAAAPDNNHERAGRNGSKWFESLGAAHVDVVPVIDKKSANSAEMAAQVRAARFIYLLGGFPGYLEQTLRDSLVWQACLEAYEEGSLIGGSSAGAMVLCENFYDPYAGELRRGLNLLPNCCVLPHHNTFGRSWSKQPGRLIPNSILIGLDEQTGILNDSERDWKVYGAGKATIYRMQQVQTFAAGEAFDLDQTGVTR